MSIVLCRPILVSSRLFLFSFLPEFLVGRMSHLHFHFPPTLGISSPLSASHLSACMYYYRSPVRSACPPRLRNLATLIYLYSLTTPHLVAVCVSVVPGVCVPLVRINNRNDFLMSSSD